MNEQPPADFDWVTARAKCSTGEMYEVLRGAARANMLTRNDILDESGDKDRFRIKDRQPRGFTIWDTWGNKRRAVDIDLTQNGVIHVDVHIGEQITGFDLALTLNDRGQCRFKVGSEEFDQWQVLKRALEPLFFG